MNRLGLDYSSARPSTAALKAAGVTFVVRYLSGGSSKDITAAEARALTDAAIDIVLVWETTANRAEAGFDAGVADARAAQHEAITVGMPVRRPIYFAVDEDTTVGPHITAYFKGIASVLDVARIGVYGGFAVVKGCLDAGLVTFAWQTSSWSHGQREARAHLFQDNNAHAPIPDTDVDHALKDDFGQWNLDDGTQP